MKPVRILSYAAMTALGAGCGDGSLELGSFYIGSSIVTPEQGGGFSVTDGDWAGLEVTIPPAAVEAEVLVGAIPAQALNTGTASFELDGGAVLLEPRDLELQQMATVFVPLRASDNEERAVLFVEFGGQVLQPSSQREGARLRAEIGRLGRLQAAFAPPSTTVEPDKPSNPAAGRCQTDRDCPPRQACNLVNQTCEDGPQCSTADDCRLGELCSTNGACTVAQTAGGRCQVNQHCPVRTVCNPAAARCQASATGPGPCRFTSDCNRGLVCDARTNRCV